MGLLKHLLFWPVTGPKFLLDFSMGKVNDVVREELTDDTPVKSELLELQLQLELGDIDEEEYARREAELMQRLREIREWREHFGMGVSGGPVRVQSADAGGSGPVTAPDEVAGAPSPDEEAGRPPQSDAPRVVKPGDATIEFDLDGDG